MAIFLFQGKRKNKIENEEEMPLIKTVKDMMKEREENNLSMPSDEHILNRVQYFFKKLFSIKA